MHVALTLKCTTEKKCPTLILSKRVPRKKFDEQSLGGPAIVLQGSFSPLIFFPENCSVFGKHFPFWEPKSSARKKERPHPLVRANTPLFTAYNEEYCDKFANGIQTILG